jgi:hypothetical protein
MHIQQLITNKYELEFAKFKSHQFHFIANHQLPKKCPLLQH